MENHPIPQDITGFKFKLVGDMTIKQFAYIAAGFILGWVIYILPLYLVIRIPLALAIIGFGIALAFMPVAGRPFDQMIVNFFKAVFNPTQYMYVKTEDQKANVKQAISTAPATATAFSSNQKIQSFADLGKKQFTNFLSTVKSKKKDKLEEKESVFIQSVTNYASSPVKTQTPQPLPETVATHSFATKTPVAADMPAPSQSATPKPEEKPKEDKKIPEAEIKNQAMELQKQLDQAKAKEAAEMQVNSKDYLEAHQKVLELQKNVNDIMLQKQELEQKIIDLQKQVAEKQPVYSPSVAKNEPVGETQFVRSIPQPLGKGVGVPITPEFPNVLTGIIKDPRGNPLPNILVEVKDLEDNAVRAFKTNALGQFASATPLVNGKYTVAFEDPKTQNRFDTIGFEAKGEIILPIEVISVDQREELRRSLFSN